MAALVGAHIVCGFTGTPLGPSMNPLTLLGPIVWSETMAAPGVCAKSAPTSGKPVFEFYALVDCYVAWGPNPDVVNGPRAYFSATLGVPQDYAAQPGDKFAWTTV